MGKCSESMKSTEKIGITHDIDEKWINFESVQKTDELNLNSRAVHIFA